MKDGCLHKNDVKRLAELGDFIRECFKKNLADKADITSLPEKGDRGEDITVIRTDSYETYFKPEDGYRELSINYEDSIFIPGTGSSKTKYGQMEATLNSLEKQSDSITNFSDNQRSGR